MIAQIMIPKILWKKFSEIIVSSVFMKKYSINLENPHIVNIITQLSIGYFFIAFSMQCFFANADSVLFFEKIKKHRSKASFAPMLWCGWRDLNPHVQWTPAPQAGQSTNSSTSAFAPRLGHLHIIAG